MRSKLTWRTAPLGHSNVALPEIKEWNDPIWQSAELYQRRRQHIRTEKKLSTTKWSSGNVVLHLPWCLCVATSCYWKRSFSLLKSTSRANVEKSRWSLEIAAVKLSSDMKVSAWRLASPRSVNIRGAILIKWWYWPGARDATPLKPKDGCVLTRDIHEWLI